MSYMTTIGVTGISLRENYQNQYHFLYFISQALDIPLAEICILETNSV